MVDGSIQNGGKFTDLVGTWRSIFFNNIPRDSNGAISQKGKLNIRLLLQTYLCQEFGGEEFLFQLMYQLTESDVISDLRPPFLLGRGSHRWRPIWSTSVWPDTSSNRFDWLRI